MRTQRTKGLVDSGVEESCDCEQSRTLATVRAEMSVKDGWRGISSALDDIHSGMDGRSAALRVLFAGSSSEIVSVARLLSSRFAVDVFSEGGAALESARADPPELVVSDFTVAELDGFSLSRELRADPQLRDIPIILLSETNSEARLKEIGIGADHYLLRPFSDHELLTRVSLHLQMVKLRREAIAARCLSEARLAGEAQAMSKLNEVSSRLWRIRSLREGLEEMLAVTVGLLGADMGIFHILDAHDGALVLAAHQGYEPDVVDLLKVLSTQDHSACGRALCSAELTVIEDVENDPLYAPFRGIARAAGYRAVMAIPLIGRDGALLGVLSLQFRPVHRPTERDLRHLELYARQAADFIERDRSDEALRESERRFRATFENAAVGMAHVGHDGTLLRVNDRMCRIVGWSAAELTKKTFQGITHPDDIDANLALLGRVLSGEIDQYVMEKRYLRKDGSVIWCNLTVGCVRKADGAVDYFISVIEDITKRKVAEEHNRFLLREVNHRAKNLLAVVQAVARQTAGEDDPKLFAERFASRLAGLAASQDLLVKSDWRGVAIGDLVRSQLAHFVGLIGTRILPDGPPIRLSPAAAQTIGMALHELATNAGKYGALSNSDGTVEVNWRVAVDGQSRQFVMRWVECGGPPVILPVRQGFGHTVMVRMVEHALDAEVAVKHDPGGLVWSISAPASSVLDVPIGLKSVGES